jgi:putative hemolysin
MTALWVILLLVVGNGVFAMTEIALVSARRARLRQMADEGNRGAARALMLLENPERFLSSVQVGITLVGVLSGAYGGAALSGKLRPWVEAVPMLAPYASQIAFGLVVTGVTYLSLVIGELVPKGLALRHAEALAAAMSRPMEMLTRAAGPLVWVLEVSTRIVMRLFGGGSVAAQGPSREEVQVLVREGIVTGSVAENESEMVEGVFDLREVLAEEIMRPKPKVLFLKADETVGQSWSAIAASRQTVFPLHEGSRDEISGMVGLRSLFASAAAGKDQPLAELAVPPVFVSENQPALTLLETLRGSPLGAALVVDEFGTTRGLITLEDLVEEIVGELRPKAAAGERPGIARFGDDGWLVDGLVEVDEIVARLPGLDAVFEGEREPFQTLAGFIVHRLDRLPEEGESFTAGPFRFEVVDMDRQRIDKVLIRELPETAAGDMAQGAGSQTLS